MKCLTFEQMMTYLDQENSEQERAEIAKHLEQCSTCRTKLANWEKDFQAFDTLTQVPPLPDSFTNEVMSTLFQSTAESKKGNKRKMLDRFLNSCWRSSIKKKVIVTVASLTLALTAAAYCTSPTFASYVQSLFSTPIQKEAQDQGITLKVKEATINPYYISVIYGFEKDGQAVTLDRSSEGKDQSSETNKVYVTDQNGKEIFDGYSYESVSNEKGETVEVVFSTLLNDEKYKNLPDQLNFHFEFDRVGDTKGNWKLHAPLNVKQLKENAKLVDVNRQFTTPQGLILNLRAWQKDSTVSQFFIDIVSTEKWNSELKKLSEKAEREFGKLPGNRAWDFIEDMNHSFFDGMFQVKNKQGQIVAAYDSLDIESVNYIHPEGRFLGYSFKPFEVGQDLTFELKALYTTEPMRVDLTTDTKSLTSKPVVKEVDGKTLKIKSVRLKTDLNPEEIIDGEGLISEKGLLIEMEGMLDKETVDYGSWVIQAGDKQYEEQYSPESENDLLDFSKPEKDANGNYKFQKVLFLKGLESIPEQISLMSTMVLKRNDVDWKIPLGKVTP